MNARQRAAQRAEVDRLSAQARAETTAAQALALPRNSVSERIEVCPVCWWMGYAVHFNDGTWRVGAHVRWSVDGGRLCPGTHQLPLQPSVLRPTPRRS